MIGAGKNTAYKDLSASGALPEAHEGRFAKALILTVVAALIALLLWAAITPVNEITSGRGVIKTRALSERVEHPDGGIISSINVVAGQEVSPGTRLMVFDTASLGREMEKLQASHDALEAERGRVIYVLEGKGHIPEFSSLSELTSEELLFWAEQSFVNAQLDLIDADSRAIHPAIDVLNARQSSMKRELEILQNRLDRNRSGQKSGVITLNTVELIEREFLQLQRAILEVDGEIASRRNALEANALRKTELQAKRNREAALRHSEIKEQIVKVQVTMVELDARIARATVTATISGTIMDMAVSNPGEVVAPGDLIAEIIPEQNSVEAEIEVSADRIGAVEVGMEARLKILSYDFTRYGEIVGKVAAVSPSSYQDDQGRNVFRVTIALPDGGETPHLANKPVLPGMTVTADILSDSKKVLSYLLKPLRALQDRAFTEA